MFTDLLFTDIALRILVLGPVSLLWITMVVRVVGLRSFSKMTAFDFITTVATGSLLGSAASATGWGAFVQANGAVLALLGIQAFVAWARLRSITAMNFFENEPILLMRDGSMIRRNLWKARVTEADVRAKLREANVLDLSKVRAVVLETTGDISVLHGDSLELDLLETVRGTLDDGNSDM